MKVLFIGSGNSPSTFIKRRINALKKCNIDVISPKTYTIFNFFNFISILIKKPFRIYYFYKIYTLQSKKSLIKKIKISFKYIDFIKTKPDIIHFQWVNHVQSFEWLIKYFNVPVVSSVRGSMVTIYPNNNPKYVKGLQKSFKLSNYVHCVSESLRQVCINNFKVNQKKVFTNYNGIDIDKFTAKKHTNNENKIFTLVSVGGLMWRKGFLFQLLVMKKLQQYPIKLVCIGDGEDRFKLDYQIKKLGLLKTVSLLGNKSEDKVIEQLQCSDIYISTSIAEGLSNSVMEAASCGLPTVVFDCEGMNEIIVNNKTGFIVPFGDVDLMVNKILLLFKDRAKMSKFANKARNHIIDNFNINNQIEKMVEFYNSVKK